MYDEIRDLMSDIFDDLTDNTVSEKIRIKDAGYCASRIEYLIERAIVDGELKNSYTVIGLLHGFQYLKNCESIEDITVFLDIIGFNEELGRHK